MNVLADDDSMSLLRRSHYLSYPTMLPYTHQPPPPPCHTRAVTEEAMRDREREKEKASLQSKQAKDKNIMML